MVIKNRREEIIPIDTLGDLRVAIEELDIKAHEQKHAIIGNVSDIKHSLNPINMLKSGVSKLAGDDNHELLSNTLKVGGTILAGVIAKKIIASQIKKHSGGEKESEKEEARNQQSHEPGFIGRMLRDAGVALLVSNADAIKNFGKATFLNLFVNKDTKVV